MPALLQPTRGFPMARIASRSGGLPIEVCLIAQLGPGGGNQVFATASGQQRGHASFVEALDEPSAKLFGIDLSKADPTSLYSFAVDADGHPFHRHAGHRVFTAVSGSGGAHLRFSTISDAELQADPAAFADSLHCVDLPPDSLFAVRFGGGTWHQFAPRQHGSRHPVFFALSCHTNELGGITDAGTADTIRGNGATIASLTELLPEPVQRALARQPLDWTRMATTSLSLHAAPDTVAMRVCTGIRNLTGRLRRTLAARRRPAGFVSRNMRHAAIEVHALPKDSLLSDQFADGFHHQDMFALTVPTGGSRGTAQQLLADVLEGFLSNPPLGVSLLMRMRNALVRPLRLRTSPLGCPVSSLLSTGGGCRFANRYPVLEQRLDPHQGSAQVLLGADDRHLRFRSCVGIEVRAGGVRVTLGTRVQCKNMFGRAYMALIRHVHRRYIAPAMLEMAVAHALQRDTQVQDCALAA